MTQNIYITSDGNAIGNWIEHCAAKPPSGFELNRITFGQGMTIDLSRTPLCTWYAKWAERSRRVTRRSQR